MVWWNGISTCTQLGVDDCVVWWDAWAVWVAVFAALVGLAALVIAFWGVLATVISSVAVWRLGQRANFLAESGAEQVRIERQALADAQSVERARESVIVLSYISAELSSIYPSISALSGQLKEVGAEERFVHEPSWRQLWREDLSGLKTARMEAVLTLLYRLPSNVGGRIARLLGDVQSLQEILNSVGPADLTADTKEEYRQTKELWLRTLFVSAKNASQRAEADIEYCFLEAARASHKVGIESPSV